MNDPIVDEVRRIRDEYAAQFNYDLDAIFRDLKEQEQKSGRTFVNYGRNTETAEATEPAALNSITNAPNAVVAATK